MGKLAESFIKKKEEGKSKKGMGEGLKGKLYKYGMKEEFAPGRYPKEGLYACLEGEVLEEHDEIFAGYNSVLFYARELTDEECEIYKIEKIE